MILASRLSPPYLNRQKGAELQWEKRRLLWCLSYCWENLIQGLGGHSHSHSDEEDCGHFLLLLYYIFLLKVNTKRCFSLLKSESVLSNKSDWFLFRCLFFRLRVLSTWNIYFHKIIEQWIILSFAAFDKQFIILINSPDSHPVWIVVPLSLQLSPSEIHMRHRWHYSLDRSELQQLSMDADCTHILGCLGNCVYVHVWECLWLCKRQIWVKWVLLYLQLTVWPTWSHRKM